MYICLDGQLPLFFSNLDKKEFFYKLFVNVLTYRLYLRIRLVSAVLLDVDAQPRRI